MSWSVNYNTSELKDDALRQNPECSDQFDIAKAAVDLILQSGSMGRGKDFHVTMTGHSNPGHEPREGWANDCLTIMISQK